MWREKKIGEDKDEDEDEEPWRGFATDLILQPYCDEPVERAPSLDDLEFALAGTQRQHGYEPGNTEEKTCYGKHCRIFMPLLVGVFVVVREESRRSRIRCDGASSPGML